MKYLAQINIAKLLEPIDHPMIADFKNNIDRINALAEAAPGFVWRLKDEYGDDTNFNPYGDPKMIVNMSIWESLDHLKEYIYESGHMEIFRRRAEWFAPMSEAHAACWIYEKGDSFPDAAEGKERLDYLRIHGPTEYAFDFRTANLYL